MQIVVDGKTIETPLPWVDKATVLSLAGVGELRTADDYTVVYRGESDDCNTLLLSGVSLDLEPGMEFETHFGLFFG